MSLLSMTKQERAIKLREAFPDATWKELGKIMGCNRLTFRTWVDPEYKNNRLEKTRLLLAERIAKHKFILVQFLGGQCSECGYRDCYEALEFHHKDPAQKIGRGVSDVLTGKFEIALEEAKKCILLCGNCHQKHHAEQPTQ